MAKYPDVTAGQTEACINRMGGWENFLRFIGGQGEVVFKVVEKVEQLKTYFKRLFTFTLGAVDGKDTLETACQVFQGYFDPDFEKCGIVFSGVAPEAEIATDELIQNGKFSNFLENVASELEKQRMLGSQFLALCRDDLGRDDADKKLRGEGYANFIVLTKGDKPVEKDLSNVFVADVSVYDGGKLVAYLRRFQYDFVWIGA